MAKAYRLLKTIMETAADDELIRRNPCRIKGAGRSRPLSDRAPPSSRSTGSPASWGARRRLLVYIAAYGPARPEEQAALRGHDADLANVGVWVRTAELELNSGKRAPGETKSGAGKRFIVLPDFMRGDLKLHM